MNKKVVSIDWESYPDTFPDRYLDYSPFDADVEAEIAKREQAEVLDIGGGVYGTQYLNCAHLKCWLLDPYIKGHPEWMVGNLDWEAASRTQFDLVVARGCFNYLTPAQIKALPSMLKPLGHLMFNTFYLPKSGSRKYCNSRSGTQGIERFQYQQERGVIEHELEPGGCDYVIRHMFFVYRLDEIIDLLGTDGLSFQFLGPNSLSVTLCGKAVSE